MSSLRSRQFKRILLIKPSAFGDVIHTLPVLCKLRARYPDARIDWLITPENAELVRNHPGLSNVVLFARRHYARLTAANIASLANLVHEIRATRYELVIDLHGQLRSAIFCVLSGAPIRIGFDRPRKSTWQASRPRLAGRTIAHGWKGAREGSWIAYTHRIPIPTLDAHAIDRYLWLGNLLGMDGSPPDMSVYVSPAADVKVRRLLAERELVHRPLAVLFPGTIWTTKHWHVQGFADVGSYLLQRRFDVVIAGGPRERLRCQAVAAACAGAYNVAGQTSLGDLAALIQRAAICITNDSGPMHLAVALQRPVVSVFGPTDALWIGPYGRPHAVVRADLPCSPCYLRRLRDCPHDHACMRDVTATMVIERVNAILGANRATA
jgi:lipopolysaccharide heptosyltransferase II